MLLQNRNSGGAIRKVVDFDVLRQELSDCIVEGPEERYQFTWPDKRKSILAANAPINKTLRPCREESVNFDTTENLYIEGDNLEVLKLLQETYLGKVKMIYIDPPYNTGNDFVYNDDFKQKAEEYLENSGQYDEYGNQMVQNTESNGRFHTDWLNMMYPRLKLAKDLLADDGVIFISIDDNEVDNLKKICDDIYGVQNYVSTHHIQVRYAEKSLADGKIVKPVMEYILIYVKEQNKFCMNLPLEEYTDENFIFKIDVNEQGKRLEYDDGTRIEVFYPGQWQLIKANKSNIDLLKETWVSGTIYSKMSYGQVVKKYMEPRYGEDGLGCLYKVYGRGDDGLGYRYYVGPNKKKSTRCKMYSGMPLERKKEILSGNKTYREVPISNLMNYAAEFGNIVNEGGMKFNSGKKPVKLLKELVNYNIGKDIVILDFFSGSATTAHAVMQLNAEDGGKRKFIMVQLPELTDEKSEAYKAGYKNICEIGKERIRRAGKKILEEHPDAKDLDIGFRVLKCDSSNMEDVYYTPADYMKKEISLFVDNVKTDRSAEDLLFQCMLELDTPLSSSIEVQEIGGKTVYNVAGGHLMACFDTDVTDEVVTEIAKLQPSYFVLRDSSMADDSVAANFEQIFKTYSPHTERRVL